MSELQMIQLLNVIIAFLIGAAIGMAIMMCNYGFFHRAVEVFRQKKRAARGMATPNKTKPKPFFAATTEEIMRYKSKDTCVSHKFSLLDHEPHEVTGLVSLRMHRLVDTSYTDEDTDQEPHAANPHKKYQVRYMCDTQGEVMATDLSYGDAQATVRCFAEDMHEELIADLIIREIRND